MQQPEKRPRLHLVVSERLMAGLRQASDQAEQSIAEYVRSTLRDRIAADRPDQDRGKHP